jgi:hypothetical protein
MMLTYSLQRNGIVKQKKKRNINDYSNGYKTMCDMFKRWTIKGRNHDSAMEGRKQRESGNQKKVGTGRER